MSEELVEIHPFAHLGPAPYRFVSVWVMPSKSLAGENPDAWNNALRSAPCAVGSCHHCSAGLTDHYINLKLWLFKQIHCFQYFFSLISTVHSSKRNQEASEFSRSWF